MPNVAINYLLLQYHHLTDNPDVQCTMLDILVFCVSVMYVQKLLPYFLKSALI